MLLVKLDPVIISIWSWKEIGCSVKRERLSSKCILPHVVIVNNNIMNNEVLDFIHQKCNNTCKTIHLLNNKLHLDPKKIT
jgi:hypothetical protein